ncbi:MAG: hypothetical protein KJZ80_11660 [Hyphomicrobiaceae bacterium]|nr:hypothetical protein [Hyphomicrobiaceae bacterium]
MATILSELSEKINAVKLAAAAATAPLPWAQRLGYLLEHVGASEGASALKSYIREKARQYTPLLPGGAKDGPPRDSVWKVVVNAEVEAEL